MQFFKVHIVETIITEIYISAKDKNEAINQTRDWHNREPDSEKIVDYSRVFLPTKITKREIEKDLI